MRRYLCFVLALQITSYSVAQKSANEMVQAFSVDVYQQAAFSDILDSGLAMLEQEEFESAEKRFFEALQIIKVNNGINSELQVPVLEKLIQAQLPQRNWKLINQYLSHFEWLNKKSSHTNFESYLTGTEALANLYLGAAADPENPQIAHYLVTARNLTWNAISAIESRAGKNSAELTPWLYRIVLSHFYQSSLVKRRGMTSYEYKSDEAVIVNGWSLSKNEFMKKSHSIGLEVLHRINKLEAQHQGKESAAISLIYLGDWETLFNNDSEATAFYTQGFKALRDADIKAVRINDLFDKAKILPELEYHSSLSELENSQNTTDQLTFYAWSPNFPTAAKPDFYRHWTKSYDQLHAILSLEQNYGPASKSTIQLTNEEALDSATRSKLLNEAFLPQLRPRFNYGKPVPRAEIQVDYFLSVNSKPAIVSSH